MTNTEMQQIAVTLLPRVQKIARGFCSRLPQHISADDLAQAGIVGMMTALRSFDSSFGDNVEHYVTRRVRGAILDELRALDPLSRDQRKDARAMSSATKSLEGELGRAPAEDEVAARAGLSLDRVRSVRGLSNAVSPMPIDAVAIEDEGSQDPIERLAAGEMRQALAGAVGELSAREQTILSLYYVEELSLKEIGGLLKVTESRVCQLMGAAVKKLRASLAS